MPDLSIYEWRQLSPATSPSARLGHAMVSDGSLVHLFGGFGGGVFLADHWTYDLATGEWTQLAPATVPTSRAYHRMIFDGARILLFGGTRTGTAFLGDLWEYPILSGTWNQLSAGGGAGEPSGRNWHAMAFAAARLLLYGGTDAPGSVPNDETFEYVAGWNQLSPAHTPGADTAAFGSAAPGRLQHRMVPLGSGALMFGGRSDSNVYPANPSNQASGNTWLFDTDWTQTAPTGDPQLRYAHCMTVTDDDQAIMFGGNVSPTGSLGEIVISDTQTYESGAWTDQAESLNPGARLNSDMAWIIDRAILFGGYFYPTPTTPVAVGDTWEYAPPPVSPVTASIRAVFGLG